MTDLEIWVKIWGAQGPFLTKRVKLQVNFAGKISFRIGGKNFPRLGVNFFPGLKAGGIKKVK